MIRVVTIATSILLLSLLGACGEVPRPGSRDAEPASDIAAALQSITADDVLEHTRVLASDAFEGRAPGTPGGQKTVAYLVDRFRELGLSPGNPDGTFVQDVPLMGVTTQAPATVRLDGRAVDLRFPEGYAAVSRHTDPVMAIEGSELVFVGYGVEAPEYGWDDFKGVDLAGKTLVMLVNDPPVPDPNDPSRLDTTLFRGPAMTYYGRWTYKYEIAAAKGAAAALIVHETGPAGYPFEVVLGGWGRENFDLATNDAPRVKLEGWISREKAEELFAAAGHDFEALKEAARRRDFEPVALGGTLDAQIRNTVRRIASQNVIARLDGADPERRDEYVVYTAHWDHLGRDTTLQGDQIFNGALDNASGTAGLVELAEAFTRLEPAPDRSIVFLAVTAEEYGLLGTRHYALNPLYPHERTLANINIDGLNQWGRTRDVVVVGYGQSSLEDVLAEEAARQGRFLVPDPEPEKGFYYRSDHFEFAKQGVPALYIDSGTEFIGKPEGYGEQKREEYTSRDYHSPSDEIKPDWDLAGAVEDLRLLFRVGYRVAEAGEYPEWKEGSEFRARREAMLGGSRR